MERFPEIRRVLRLGAHPAELNEELAFHFDETVAELMEKGVPRRQAEEEARRRFGDERHWRRELRRIDRGAALRQGWTERAAAGWSAVRYAFRRVRRAPGLALSVVLTFGLGIGANATVFGIVDRLLLSPPAHVEGADDVQRLLVRQENQGGNILSILSYPNYRDIGAARSFSAIAGYTERTVLVDRGEEGLDLSASLTTASFFPLLGVRAALGRFYTPDEDRIGEAGVVVIGNELWRSQYGGAADVLGRTIDFGYGPYTIVGVAPAGFTGIELRRVDLWLPLHTALSAMAGSGWENGRYSYWLHVVGRLAAGATAAAASDEATTLLRQGDSEAGLDSENLRLITASMIAARGPNAPPEAAVARWLAGLSLLVLLVACANVANLLLADAVRKRREVAIRLAMGSSRARIIGQVLTECLLLAALGGAAAMLLAYFGSRMLGETLLPDVNWRATGLEGRVAGLVLLLALVAGLAAGVIPAIQATRSRLSEALKGGGRGVLGGGGYARNSLTVLQVALSVVLLAGSGLFVRSMHEVRSLDLGFDPDGLLLFNPTFARGVTEVRMKEVMERARERLLQVPGVQQVSGDVTVPLQSLRGAGLRVPGVDSIPGTTAIHVVDPGYFSAVGLRILRGRPITEDDQRLMPRVAVINETMARRLWPGEDALGRCLIVSEWGADLTAADGPPCSTVVGVAEDARNFQLVEDPSMHYFVPAAQEVVEMIPEALLIRVRGDAEPMIRDVQRALADVDPGLRHARVRPMQELIDPLARSWRLGAAMFTAFGLLALVVAGIGLYSVLAFGVAERTQELGIRSALGAQREWLIRLVVTQATCFAGVGVALGLLLVMLASPRIEPLLFQVRPRDPLTLAIAALTLILVAALAGLVPAIRATRVDPTHALRAD